MASDDSTLTVGSVTSVDKNFTTFRANTIIVDNLTNQWVLVQNGVWVQPYVVRAMIPVTGIARMQVKFSTPTGASFQQTATIAGEQATITATDEVYPPSPGIQVPVRAPSTEWRNPKEVIFSNTLLLVGPVAFSSDFSYTVPPGRRAQLDTSQVMAEIFASDGSGSGTQIGCYIGEDVASLTASLLAANIWAGTALGARADGALSASLELGAGQVLRGVSGNPRGAGVTLRIEERCHITEGDA